MSWWEFRGFWGILQRSHAVKLPPLRIQTASAIKKPEKIGLKVKAASPLKRLSPKNRSGFMTAAVQASTRLRICCGQLILNRTCPVNAASSASTIVHNTARHNRDCPDEPLCFAPQESAGFPAKALRDGTLRRLWYRQARRQPYRRQDSSPADRE